MVAVREDRRHRRAELGGAERDEAPRPGRRRAAGEGQEDQPDGAHAQGRPREQRLDIGRRTPGQGGQGRGFRDVSDFYGYLESRRTLRRSSRRACSARRFSQRRCHAEVLRARKGHLHKSVELVDGVSPKELRERYRVIKQIDSSEDLSASNKKELKERALRLNSVRLRERNSGQ